MHKLTWTGIRDAFAGGWHVDSIRPSTIDITTGPGSVQAWLAAVTRV